MFQNTFNSIINTYQYLNMMNLSKIALDAKKHGVIKTKERLQV